MGFSDVYKIDVNDKTEQKDGLTYLSWAWAWAEFKKVYPEATYDIIKSEEGKCYFGDEDVGYMVYTAVLAEGIRHEMCLPVLDGANKAMKRKPYIYEVKNKNYKYATLNKEDGKYYDKYGNEQSEFFEKKVEAMSMFDVNKAIMRCLTKNLAMFGLGLYIYAGEDLPEGDGGDNGEEKPKNKPADKPKTDKKVKSFEPLTKAEMVEKYGVSVPEQTAVWLEGRFGKELKNFTEEETAWARAELEKKKKQKEAAAREKLNKLGDEDIPFPMTDKE